MYEDRVPAGSRCECFEETAIGLAADVDGHAIHGDFTYGPAEVQVALTLLAAFTIGDEQKHAILVLGYAPQVRRGGRDRVIESLITPVRFHVRHRVLKQPRLMSEVLLEDEFVAIGEDEGFVGVAEGVENAGDTSHERVALTFAQVGGLDQDTEGYRRTVCGTLVDRTGGGWSIG